MESWNFVSEGKGFASDETIVPTNSLPRSKNGFLGWELRTCSFGNNMFLSGQQDDSTSKLSSSVVDSNSRDSSSIDLKLGRLPDYKDDHFSKFSNGVVPILASSESSRPAKRMRAMGVYSQTAFCQVYGCNKDLNASKDYHKRHKVCEDHSKTAKVIVNGIEQRFCQQCSRFHLLGEFDDGKRSCRKRLAGHNQRRRKPQVGIHSGRAGRLLQSYNDIRSVGSSLSTTSFICQEFLPSGLSHHEKYGTDDWCKPIKVEDGTDYRPLSTIPVTSVKLHSKSLLPHDIGKHFTSFHDNGASTATGSTFCDNTSQYTNDVGCPTSSSHSLFQNTPLASEDFNVFDAASTVQGLSTISDSGCALSLLSSHSQKPSSHSSGIPMARPLIMPGSHPHYGMSRVSEKFSGIASQDSLSGVSNKFPSSEMNSAEENHLSPILISDNRGAVNFEITDRMFQGSDCLNSDNRHSYESGPTVDLLQLSSQLQRVEHQRQFMQMKQDNDAFCSLRIT